MPPAPLQIAQSNQLMDLFAGLGPAVIGEIPFMMAKFAVFDAVSKVNISYYISYTGLTYHTYTGHPVKSLK
jgi:hypothetical protein